MEDVQTKTKGGVDFFAIDSIFPNALLLPDKWLVIYKTTNIKLD